MNLITNIKVKNFFSIKDTVEINFEASKNSIKNNKNRIYQYNNKYYNKVISIYGANASGKTTILKAMVYLSDVINHEETNNFPHSLKNKFSNEELKSEIDISFILTIDNNSREFLYQIKFNNKNFENIGIDNEILYEIKDNQKIILFNKEEKIIANVEEHLKANIFNNLSSSKSLFTEFENFEDTSTLKQIRLFFRDARDGTKIGIHNTISDDEYIIGMYLKTLEHSSEDGTIVKNDLCDFLISFFKSIDIDIARIEPKFDIKTNEFISLAVYHQIDDTVPLEFKFESDGIQMLMKILLDIFMIKVTNSILIIDEFDCIIHPMFTPIILDLLIDNNIQIIYSTHNIYNMKFLKNDEIFFIEKDLNYKTIINAVKDNKNIKGDENLLIEYEKGALGGIPNIRNLITKIR